MRTPLHLWVVGVVSLLWNAGGAYDYLMTQMGNQAYLSMLTAEQASFMAARPTWFDAAWAFGVWGSVAGSLLLLLRSKWAAPAFGISLLGLIASSVWSYGIAEPSSLDLMGTFGLLFSAAIVMVLVGLYFYARVMAARRYLR